MTTDIAEQVEATLDAPTDEFQSELPTLLDDLTGQEQAFADSHPELFTALVARLDDLDIAAFVEEYPETADQFQDVLWNGMEVLVANDPDLQAEITTNVSVNFEANDCEMVGHIELDMDQGTITGGAGTLDDATLRIGAPADTLVGFVTGSVDPVQGFLSQSYNLDGPLGKGTKLAPVMANLSESIPS